MKTGSKSATATLEERMIFMLRNLGVIDHNDALLMLCLALRYFYDDYTEDD
jgi:hypothetical protein